MAPITIFDVDWINNARANTDDTSWVSDLIATLDTSGGIYLASLRLWFNRFPLNEKQKRGLAAKIENFRNEDHLGAVNELAWWAFLRQEQFNANPIAVRKSSTPDFWVRAPSEFFIEVSTFNVSKKDQLTLRVGDSVKLDHAGTMRRILEKFTDEKQKQFNYAVDRKMPCVLVLFDYTTWSAFGTHFYRFLANFLLGNNRGFQSLPVELSALVYVERKVFDDGRIAISRARSGVYYNPNAKYSLPEGTFTSLNQFWGQMVEPEAITTLEGWVWL